MIHARSDYKNIQQCDKPALRKLYNDMINAMLATGMVNMETRIEFHLRFEQIMAETIPVNEPVFLVRGQDEVGAAAVRAWAHLHKTSGGADPVYMMAMRHADQMECWPKKKLADMPAGIFDPNDIPEAIIGGNIINGTIIVPSITKDEPPTVEPPPDAPIVDPKAEQTIEKDAAGQ